MGRRKARSRPGGRVSGATQAAGGKTRKPQPHWAIVTYLSDHASGEAGFYLDSIITGTKADAEVELAAVQTEQRHKGYCPSFVAPVTAGRRGLSGPVPRGGSAPTFNIWLLRRDANGFREYEVQALKCSGGDTPPSHEKEWQAICIEKGWERRVHKYPAS